MSSVLETVDLNTITEAIGTSTATKIGVTTRDLSITTEATEMSMAVKKGVVMAGAAIMITEERATEMANGAHLGTSKYSVCFKGLDLGKIRFSRSDCF